MKLAVFNEGRLGVVTDDVIADVTDVLPAWDSGFLTNWWTRLCDSFAALSPKIVQAESAARKYSLGEVRLRAPVLNPSKIVATAASYRGHINEMRGATATSWLANFGVFLKAPSSIIGPEDTVILPPAEVGRLQHESGLALIIGKRAKDVAIGSAWQHVLGFTCYLDITYRGDADRCTRKSYDGFTPVGPWVVTADEIPDPHKLQIRLWANGELRQDTNSSGMTKTIPEIIALASSIMTLNSGDIVTTGSAPGVGNVLDRDRIVVEIERIGGMTIYAKDAAKQ